MGNNTGILLDKLPILSINQHYFSVSYGEVRYHQSSIVRELLPVTYFEIYISNDMCRLMIGCYLYVFSVLLFLFYILLYMFMCVYVDSDMFVICMPMTESQQFSWYANLKDLVFHM